MAYSKKSNMKVALAQINPTVGDLEGNKNKIIDWYQRALAKDSDLVIFPELAVCGYPPLDFMARPTFVKQCEFVLDELAQRLQPVDVILGVPLSNPKPEGRAVFNAAVLLSQGEVKSTHLKTRLPSYDVFDEDRYFEPASKRESASILGKKVGITICEDIWDGPETDRQLYKVDPIDDLAATNLDLIVNISASPFNAGKSKVRHELVATTAQKLNCPVVYVNQVGGNDSLLFDGNSIAVDKNGKLVGRAQAFGEDLIMVDFESGTGDLRPVGPQGIGELRQAIVMGIRDYMQKCGFKRLVLGLSGGIDSAVCAVLAVEAAGASNVSVLAMPSKYSSTISRDDAQRLAKNLGIGFTTIPIDSILEEYRQALKPGLGDVSATLSEENLQARIRGALVMAHSNHIGAMALATGNKSELAVGYCTLYGDMVGGLAPIGDLLKGQVYHLAELINQDQEIIPRRIIDRPPSAELRPDQVDQDSLPPYDVLDQILELVVTEGLDADSIVAKGYPQTTVEEVIRLVENNEFKRRQAAPVLRVTRRAFGAGRRIPIARGPHGGN
jgi:NAD+ synthetase